MSDSRTRDVCGACDAGFPTACVCYPATELCSYCGEECPVVASERPEGCLCVTRLHVNGLTANHRADDCPVHAAS